ncbi:MAG TPA: GspE/PulE family protein, partial [Candidatus Paceibacterota bacterium]|nr:GspE/PulE family protein [Candidatus Paceibacterota bacterium]
FAIEDREIGVRTSVIPGAYGESVVMRLLDPKMISIPLEELGINKRLFEVINREIEKPNGLILNTGPTGSGKTTSLYAFLNKIYTPEMKIITIENPIEYHLEGIVQTQVDTKRGYTFLEGLRSALRQDPDVIMIGEIRDLETARTAINSALTGHLVISTLHTNNAAGTIPRLVDLGVNPKIISSALTLALAQRLVRKLCEACKVEDVQTDPEREVIDRILAGIATDRPKNHGKIWRSKGCQVCNNTGYTGRVPVIEGILMDKKIEDALQHNPSEREIMLAAKDQNLLTMSQDGVLKILEAVTSMNEVQRVVDLFHMD